MTINDMVFSTVTIITQHIKNILTLVKPVTYVNEILETNNITVYNLHAWNLYFLLYYVAIAMHIATYILL